MKKHAFTLIEMLITIGIIAILSCILLPAVGSAIRKADQTKAKAEITTLVNAIKQFEATYGYLPYPTVSGAYTEGEPLTSAQYEDLIKVLQGISDNIDDTYTRNPNPKRQKFLDVQGNDTGSFVDPWGNNYRVIFDKDGNGSINFATAPTAELGLNESSRIYASVIVWSDGAKLRKNAADASSELVLNDNVYSLPVEWNKSAKKFDISK